MPIPTEINADINVLPNKFSIEFIAPVCLMIKYIFIETIAAVEKKVLIGAP